MYWIYLVHPANLKGHLYGVSFQSIQAMNIFTPNDGGHNYYILTGDFSQLRLSYWPFKFTGRAEFTNSRRNNLAKYIAAKN